MEEGEKREIEIDRQREMFNWSDQPSWWRRPSPPLHPSALEPAQDHEASQSVHLHAKEESQIS